MATGGGNGPVVVLLHGFGAPGNNLVPLDDVLDVPTGTRFIFPEDPLSLSFGPRDARAWWLIDMARMAQDQAAGRARDFSNEIPKGLAPAHGAVRTRFVLVQYGEGRARWPKARRSSGSVMWQKHS